MSGWKRRLIGLGLPCLLAWGIDVALTLHCQPAEFWAGDYSRTTEGAGFYRRLYQFHPTAGVGGHLFWAALIAGLLALLPTGPAVVLALAVAFGHTWGASTWITQSLITRAAWGSPGPLGWYQATHLLLVTTAVTTGIGVRWVVTRDTSCVPSGWRWTLIALLAGAIGAIVFVPW